MSEEHNVIDLDEILPPKKQVEFTAADGRKYSVTLFIPSAVALLIVNNAKIFQKLFPSGGGMPQIDEEVLNVVLRILEMVLQREHTHMTAEWIDKNMELPQLIVLLLNLLKPLYEYFQNSGLAEMAKP